MAAASCAAATPFVNRSDPAGSPLRLEQAIIRQRRARRVPGADAPRRIPAKFRRPVIRLCPGAAIVQRRQSARRWELLRRLPAARLHGPVLRSFPPRWALAGPACPTTVWQAPVTVTGTVCGLRGVARCARAVWSRWIGAPLFADGRRVCSMQARWDFRPLRLGKEGNSALSGEDEFACPQGRHRFPRRGVEV